MSADIDSAKKDNESHRGRGSEGRCTPRCQGCAAPCIEARGVVGGREIGQVSDGHSRRRDRLARTHRNDCPGAMRNHILSESDEDVTRRLTETIDPIQRRPRHVQRIRIGARMLQRKGSEGLAVAASPWFLPRVVEREQGLKSSLAGIRFARVARAALGADHSPTTSHRVGCDVFRGLPDGIGGVDWRFSRIDAEVKECIER